MKKYITNLYGQSENSTAMLAQNMVTQIAKEEGFEEIYIKAYPVQNDTIPEKIKRIDGILSAVSRESLIIAQMPTWNGIAFDEVILERISESVEKLVVFVHDFVPLMFVNNAYLMDRYILAYNKADLVILPSQQMEEILRKHGLNVPVLIQEVWDHKTSIDLNSIPKFQKKIKFIGNVSRFPFVKSWKSDLELEVYSRGEIEAEGYITMKGWLYDDQLLRTLNKGGFGLVWSEDIENQLEREYSKMNTSFKFSTYLASGLPLIVNKGLSKEKFVKKYDLGVVVENLEEASDFVKTITKDEYERYCLNVRRFAHLIKDGYFTKKLLIDIQTKLFLK